MSNFVTGLPPNTFQLFRPDGSPVVGGVISKSIQMCVPRKGDVHVKPFPVALGLEGIDHTAKYFTAQEEIPSYWLVVNHEKRQSKWKRFYTDDDE